MTSEEKTLITGQNILVISPQRWGKMHVSKHHYAVELARMGNNVFFLNPPMSDLNSSVELKQHESIENLTLVSYRLFFPYKIRFHLRWLFGWLMCRQIRTILENINVSFDIAWCFDTNLFSNLRIFGANKVIYHLADQVMIEEGIKAAATADIVISVDQALLAKLDDIDVPKQVVGHGLAEPFALQAEKRLAKHHVMQSGGKQVKVGYVGNLLISSLDRATFRRIIEENKEAIFHFWGTISANENNIGVSASPDISSFIDFLKASSNVTLHGVTAPQRLAEEIQSMDVFLLCYDINNDINGGCNSHKILEYFSTGKVVIGNRMSTYIDSGDLIKMCCSNDNSDLPHLFADSIAKLPFYNNKNLQKQRLTKALENRYNKQIDRVIEQLKGVSQ